MLWLVVAINYLDRAVLSIALPKMVEEFHFSTKEMGVLLSAFFWAYALLQMPAGWLADKIGQKKTLSIAVILWSLATITTSFVTGFKSLIAFRLGLGVGEAGAYPSNAGIVAKWFPDRERATVSGIFDSAAGVGAALCLPLIVWLIATAGWRMTFILTGLTGIVWLIGWLYFFTDDPRNHKMVNEAELKYIVDGQRISVAADEGNKIRWYELLKYRNVWSVPLGLFVGSYNSYFFITWFPIYLVTQKHVSFLHMGMFASLPPLAGMCSELFTGWLSDRLLAKGILSLTAVRKLFLITGMILATAICFAAFADSATVAVAVQDSVT